MEFRKLGSSEIEVSALSLGSWLTYERMDERDALAVIGAALEAGINFLDDARYDDRMGTAPMKTGYSEVLFGRLLRKGGWNRADLVIANKLWYEFYPDESPEGELDGSLGRLGLDYLDLEYCAPPPASLPVADVVRQMDALIRTGKLRYWGVLNWPVTQIEEAWRVATSEGLTVPCAAQLAYSLLSTSPVEDEPLRQLFETTGIGVVASYSLYGGLLTGKYNRPEAAAGGRLDEHSIEAMRRRKLLAKVDRVIDIAREVNCSPAQLALAYCLNNPQVSSVLFGATKVAQVEENVRTLETLPLVKPVLAKVLAAD
jgi:aryl-alcohol dehydrogenase-like predicted oxidoreductase